VGIEFSQEENEAVENAYREGPGTAGGVKDLDVVDRLDEPCGLRFGEVAPVSGL